MKREVIGYSKMESELLDSELLSSPFFFASPDNTMMGKGVENKFHQSIPFTQLAAKANEMLQAAKKALTDELIRY